MTIIHVTVTATNPVSLDLEVEMDTPMPTEPQEQAAWTHELEVRTACVLSERSEQMDMDGYLAEWLVNYAGGWETTTDPPCDVVDDCLNRSVDCVGGEVYFCNEHRDQAGDVYEAWQASPERAARIAARSTQ